jgi:hypothetical protein
MENRNLNLFEWISKIIDTCHHDFHFEAVDRLISLYFEREKNDEKRHELELLKVKKWNEIHTILK